MLFLLGKSGSGKTAIGEELIKSHGYTKIVTYTTRPKRAGEVEGRDYHFVTDETFEAMKRNAEFAEVQSFRGWSYGTRRKDLEEAGEKSFCILNPKAFRTLDTKGDTSAYLLVTEGVLEHRLFARGDCKEEIARRMQADTEDFTEIEGDVTFCVTNNCQSIASCAKRIALLHDKKIG